MRRVLLAVLALSLCASAQMFPFPGPGSKPAVTTCGAVGSPCTDSFQNETVIDAAKWTKYGETATPTLSIGGTGASSYLKVGAAGSGLTGKVLMAYTGGTFTANQSASITVNALTIVSGNNPEFGPAIHISDATHYTRLKINAAGAYIQEANGAAETQLGASKSYSWQAGDVITLAVSSTTVTATITRGGSTLLTWTGTTALSTGSPGISGNNGYAANNYWQLNTWSGVSQ